MRKDFCEADDVQSRMLPSTLHQERRCSFFRQQSRNQAERSGQGEAEGGYCLRRGTSTCVSVPGAGRWSSRYLRTLPVAMPRTSVLSVCGCDSPSSGPSAAHSATSRCSSAFSASRPLKRPWSCAHGEDNTWDPQHVLFIDRLQ